MIVKLIGAALLLMAASCAYSQTIGANALCNGTPCANVTPTTIGADTANASKSVGNGYLSIAATAGTGGVTANTIASFSGASVILPTVGTAYAGIVDATAASGSTTQVARFGLHACVFDGAATIGDIVVPSTTTLGDCHDGGASTSVVSSLTPIVGVVQTTVSAAGATGTVRLHHPGSFGTATAATVTGVPYGTTVGSPYTSATPSQLQTALNDPTTNTNDRWGTGTNGDSSCVTTLPSGVSQIECLIGGKISILQNATTSVAGTYAPEVKTLTTLGPITASTPDSNGNVLLTVTAPTNTALTNAANNFTTPGAASTPAITMSGTPYTGGTGTTTYPLFYINQGATSPTFSVNGTEFGINAPSGYTGNLLQLWLNGTSEFSVTNTGSVSMLGQLNAANLQATSTVTAKNFTNTVYTLAYSATPILNNFNGAVQTTTLTGNATASSAGIAAGQHMQFEICQDATGGRTWTWPAAYHGGMTIGSAASTCSVQSFTSYNGSTFIADNAGISGIAP